MSFEISYHYCLIFTIVIMFFLFSILDFRLKIIPNVMIFITIGFRIIISLIFQIEYKLIITDFVLKTIISFFCLVLYKKDLMGAGDVKMIILVIMYVEEEINPVFLLVFFLLIWIQLLIMKIKIKKNVKIPLAPVFFISFFSSTIIFEFLGFF